MTKSAKEDVHYGPGMLQSHCGPIFHDDKFYCKHFRPSAMSGRDGGCDIVQGRIEPDHWCELYSRVKKP